MNKWNIHSSALILILFSPLAYSNEIALSLEQVVKNDRWSIGQGRHQGKPLILRFRRGLGQKVDISKHPKMIRVEWHYATNGYGMPDSVTNKAMYRFEDRLINVVEKDLMAVLVLVMTNNGKRQWLFYSKSIPVFSKRLAELVREREPYPITIKSVNDPRWQFFYKNTYVKKLLKK